MFVMQFSQAHRQLTIVLALQFWQHLFTASRIAVAMCFCIYSTVVQKFTEYSHRDRVIWDQIKNISVDIFSWPSGKLSMGGSKNLRLDNDELTKSTRNYVKSAIAAQ